jgi:hypothetical protein
MGYGQVAREIRGVCLPRSLIVGSIQFMPKRRDRAQAMERGGRRRYGRSCHGTGKWPKLVV